MRLDSVMVHYGLAIKSNKLDHLAAQREFDIAVLVVSSPVGLITGVAVGSRASGLPWLVKSLEVEHVEAPVQGSTDSVLVECRGVGGSRLCGSVVRTAYETH